MLKSYHFGIWQVGSTVLCWAICQTSDWLDNCKDWFHASETLQNLHVHLIQYYNSSQMNMWLSHLLCWNFYTDDCFYTFFSSSRPEQNSYCFGDGIMFEENLCILIKIFHKICSNSPMDNKTLLVQQTVLLWEGNRPLAKPMMMHH